jgi:hypothetical protein
MSLVKISGNASGTGTLTIAAPNTNTNYTLTLPTATGTFLTNSGTEAGAFSTLSVNSNNISAENSLGFRNRIINGDMRIDQRNAGASVTPTANAYTLDRWIAGLNVSSKFSVQRSTTAPTGFVNSVLITSTSAYSVLSADRFAFTQFIEGLNTADLAWGTASAKTVTLSFWVRSSLTGTFGGALQNNAADRSYPFTYTINVANTFEYKTVTIAGDTTGTWLTDNQIGIQVRFSLGTGTTYSGTAGAWAGADYRSATGAVSLVGTNGATLYITGVQLEVGSVATPFERRDYGTELNRCFRYFQMIARDNNSILPTTFVCQAAGSPGNPGGNIPLLTAMRTEPTVFQTATDYRFNGNNGDLSVAGTFAVSGAPFVAANYQTVNISFSVTVNVGATAICRIILNSGYFGVSAEL